MGFFRRKREDESQAEVYSKLRQQVLSLTANQLGEQAAEAPILALLMETGYPEAVATLVAVADDTTSLYFSNGGGFIGAGTHAPVVEASRRWLETGRSFLPQLEAVTGPAPPAEGLTQFVAVLPEGLRSIVAPEEELGEGRHRLSPLFHSGHEVITQIRLLDTP